MIHFDMAEKKLFQFFYCLWSHLFPCPRVQHLELAAHKATLKATPLVLSGKICQGDRSAIDLVRVTKANRFMAKPQDFIDEHVEAGDVEALFIKGLIFYHTHNNQNELKFSEKLIQKAAMGENSDAMLFLATLHMHRAKNSTNDAAIAVEWVEKAANAGNVLGMECLARMYARGLYGLPENQFQAFYWWRKAARLGSRNGMIMLYSRLYFGKGCWKNQKAAHVWRQRWEEMESE